MLKEFQISTQKRKTNYTEVLLFNVQVEISEQKEAKPKIVDVSLKGTIWFDAGVVHIIAVMEFAQVVFKLYVGCIRKLNTYKKTVLKQFLPATEPASYFIYFIPIFIGLFFVAKCKFNFINLLECRLPDIGLAGRQVPCCIGGVIPGF